MDSKDRDYMITAGELSSILAHEIKNPMNSIIINIEVLRNTIIELTKDQESSTSQKARKYLDTIEGEIRRLDRVIKGFLDFATPPQQMSVKFKVNPIIQTIAEFIHLELEKNNVQLVLELATDIPQIVGSPDYLKQALMNLLLNSMHALPSGGQIRISSGVAGDKVFIKIQDNGTGIPKEIQEKIFLPYFTTKAKGSGLGLTIVRRIINEHRGEMILESDPGKGTLFTLRFNPVGSSSGENK